MTWVAAIGVNLLVPLLGVISFVFLCRWMLRTHIQSPPLFSYFILFSIYGGWLLIGLTDLFWKWSGIASLCLFGLVFVAPVVTAGIAFTLRNRRTLSGFHRGAYIASFAYTCFILIAAGAWFGTNYLGQPPE